MRELTAKKRLGRVLDRFVRLAFRFFQPFGLHILRNHFYSPVPDTSRIPEESFRRRSGLVGINMNERSHETLMRSVFPAYVRECDFPYGKVEHEGGFHLGNDYFEAVDAEVYHCLIRHYRPRQVLEIGSGNSTVVALRAAEMNRREGVETFVTCVEPYPDRSLHQRLHGAGRLIEKPVQSLDLDLFESLSRNDILFIDSSHVAKFDSDLVFEYLEILPRLGPGVLVHIHDIFIPFDYPRRWIIDEHKFWNEQYLLQAFLCFNKAFDVLWSSSYMSVERSAELEEMFPSWKDSLSKCPGAVSPDGKNVWPVSFWIVRNNA